MSDRHDPQAPLLELDSPSGEFRDDGGYGKFIPIESELERMNEYFRQEIEDAWNDDSPRREKILANLEVVEAKPKGKGVVIPIARRDGKQVVAWLVNTIMRRHPFISVSPEGGQSVAVQVEAPGIGLTEVEKTSEEVAKELEKDAKFRFTRRVNFRSLLMDVLGSVVNGATPGWIKICHDKRDRLTTRPNVVPRFELGSKGRAIRIEGKRLKSVQKSDPNKMYAVSSLSMLMPADAQDEQDAPWLAERIPATSAEIREGIQNGSFFLVKDKEEAEKILGATSLICDTAEESRKAQITGRSASSPRQLHDRLEIWFDWDVRISEEVEDGTEAVEVGVDEFGEPIIEEQPVFKQEERIITVPMVGQFHRGAGKFLSIHVNPYQHGLRPYVPLFQWKRPHEFSGWSTTEEIAPFQKLISAAITMEMKNAALANTVAWQAVPDSPAFNWLTENGEIEAGDVVPTQALDQEARPFPIGRDMRPLQGIIGYLNAETEKVSLQSNFQRGTDVPNRTAAATVSQILDAGLTQPGMVLDSICDQLSKAVSMYYEMLQQYLPSGEVYFWQDPESREVVEVALRFPSGPITNHFRFSMTASSDDLTKEQEFERHSLLKNIIDKDNQSMAQMMGPYIDIQAPPPVELFMEALIKRSDEVTKLIVGSSRQDDEKFTIAPALRRIAEMKAEMRAQQAQAAAGGMNEGADAGANGPLPGGAEGQPNTGAAMGGAPAYAGGGAGAPEGGLPPGDF